MNASQLALSAAKAKPLFEEEARRRQVTDTTDSANLHGETGKVSEITAQVFNVSPRLVETASAVIRDGVDELVQMVLDGEVRVSAALPVANMSKADQRKAIDRGAKHIQKMSTKARVGSCKKLMQRIHKSMQKFCDDNPNDAQLFVVMTLEFLETLKTPVSSGD
jgi:hypothetical protein